MMMRINKYQNVRHCTYRREMSDSTATMPESHPMNGGDGTYSYTKNSTFQVKKSLKLKRD